MQTSENNRSETSSFKSQLEKNDLKMAKMRNDGLSLEFIGSCFPYKGKPRTKEGVRVALKRAEKRGYIISTQRGITKGKEYKHSIKSKIRKKRAQELYLSNCSEIDIINQLGICPKTLRAYLMELNEYTQAKTIARQSPKKSKISYEEIFRLRNLEKHKINYIADLAGVTPSRISQILYRYKLKIKNPN